MKHKPLHPITHALFGLVCMLILGASLVPSNTTPARASSIDNPAKILGLSVNIPFQTTQPGSFDMSFEAYADLSAGHATLTSDAFQAYGDCADKVTGMASSQTGQVTVIHPLIASATPYDAGGEANPECTLYTSGRYNIDGQRQHSFFAGAATYLGDHSFSTTAQLILVSAANDYDEARITQGRNYTTTLIIRDNGGAFITQEQSMTSTCAGFTGIPSGGNANGLLVQETLAFAPDNLGNQPVACVLSGSAFVGTDRDVFNFHFPVTIYPQRPEGLNPTSAHFRFANLTGPAIAGSTQTLRVDIFAAYPVVVSNIQIASQCFATTPEFNPPTTASASFTITTTVGIKDFGPNFHSCIATGSLISNGGFDFDEVIGMDDLHFGVAPAAPVQRPLIWLPIVIR